MLCLTKKQLLVAVIFLATALFTLTWPANKNHRRGAPDVVAVAAANNVGTTSGTTTITTSMMMANQPTCHQSIDATTISTLSSSTTTATTHHILILGGGLAGLAAACQLLFENNKNKKTKWQITLLEGRNRLGGRVFTVNNKGNSSNNNNNNTPIDLGGMYFHGMWPHHYHHHGHRKGGKDMMIPLDATEGTSAHPAQGKAVWWKQQPQQGDERGTNVIDDNDSDFSWSIMTDLEKQQGHTLLEEWVEYMKKQQKNNVDIDNNNKTDTLTIQQWWNKAHAELCQNLSATQQVILDFFLQMHFDLDRGVPFYQHTPTGLDTDWDWKNLESDAGDHDDDDFIASHGMEALINHIVSSLGDDVSIHLNQKVERIERYDICEDSAAETKKKWGCRVTTSTTTDKQQDRRHWSADACIVTLPIGVLKKMHAADDHLFVPPLSKTKQAALERAGVGTLNTIAVQWKRPICALNTTAHYMIPFQQQQQQQQANVMDGNPLRYGFVCPGILRKQYMDATITQFYTSETNLPYDNETYWKEQAWQVVRAVVPTITMQDIKQIHVSAWHMDPFSLGSYSAPTMWTCGNEDRQELAKPEHDVWFFAGEHTHYSGRYQSLDGAYETGVRAAKQVQDYYFLGQNA